MKLHKHRQDKTTTRDGRIEDQVTLSFPITISIERVLSTDRWIHQIRHPSSVFSNYFSIVHIPVKDSLYSIIYFFPVLYAWLFEETLVTRKEWEERSRDYVMSVPLLNTPVTRWASPVRKTQPCFHELSFFSLTPLPPSPELSLWCFRTRPFHPFNSSLYRYQTYKHRGGLSIQFSGSGVPPP